MWRGLVLAAAFLAAAPVSQANVPPMGWRPPTYAGPGVFCGAGFNLRLAPGEVLTLGYPNEGYIAATVRSPRGAFAVVMHDFNRPKYVKRLIATRPGGRIFEVVRVSQDYASGIDKRRIYWFEPKDRRASPFSLSFFAAIAGEGGWPEFPPGEYGPVIERVSFDLEGQETSCLAPAATP